MENESYLIDERTERKKEYTQEEKEKAKNQYDSLVRSCENLIDSNGEINIKNLVFSSLLDCCTRDKDYSTSKEYEVLFIDYDSNFKIEGADDSLYNAYGKIYVYHNRKDRRTEKNLCSKEQRGAKSREKERFCQL